MPMSTFKLRIVLEGYAKYRDGRKWKKRYCLLSSSPSTPDALHLYISKSYDDFAPYRNAGAVLAAQLSSARKIYELPISSESRSKFLGSHNDLQSSDLFNIFSSSASTTGPLVNTAHHSCALAAELTSSSLSIASSFASNVGGPSPVDEITGFESGYHMDKESNVVVLIGVSAVYTFALPSMDEMFRWANMLDRIVVDNRFRVTLRHSGDGSRLPHGLQGSLHIQHWRICLIGEPSMGCKFINSWRLDQIESAHTMALSEQQNVILTGGNEHTTSNNVCTTSNLLGSNKPTNIVHSLLSSPNSTINASVCSTRDKYTKFMLSLDCTQAVGKGRGSYIFEVDGGKLFELTVSVEQLMALRYNAQLKPATSFEAAQLSAAQSGFTSPGSTGFLCNLRSQLPEGNSYEDSSHAYDIGINSSISSDASSDPRSISPSHRNIERKGILDHFLPITSVKSSVPLFTTISNPLRMKFNGGQSSTLDRSAVKFLHKHRTTFGQSVPVLSSSASGTGQKSSGFICSLSLTPPELLTTSANLDCPQQQSIYTNCYHDQYVVNSSPRHANFHSLKNQSAINTSFSNNVVMNHLNPEVVGTIPLESNNDRPHTDSSPPRSSDLCSVLNTNTTRLQHQSTNTTTLTRCMSSVSAELNMTNVNCDTHAKPRYELLTPFNSGYVNDFSYLDSNGFKGLAGSGSAYTMSNDIQVAKVAAGLIISKKPNNQLSSFTNNSISMRNSMFPSNRQSIPISSPSSSACQKHITTHHPPQFPEASAINSTNNGDMNPACQSATGMSHLIRSNQGIIDPEVFTTDEDFLEADAKYPFKPIQLDHLLKTVVSSVNLPVSMPPVVSAVNDPLAVRNNGNHDCPLLNQQQFKQLALWISRYYQEQELYRHRLQQYHHCTCIRSFHRRCVSLNEDMYLLDQYNLNIPTSVVITPVGSTTANTTTSTKSITPGFFHQISAIDSHPLIRLRAMRSLDSCCVVDPTHNRASFIEAENPDDESLAPSTDRPRTGGKFRPFSLFNGPSVCNIKHSAFRFRKFQRLFHRKHSQSHDNLRSRSVDKTPTNCGSKVSSSFQIPYVWTNDDKIKSLNDLKGETNPIQLICLCPRHGFNKCHAGVLNILPPVLNTMSQREPTIISNYKRRKKWPLFPQLPSNFAKFNTCNVSSNCSCTDAHTKSNSTAALLMSQALVSPTAKRKSKNTGRFSSLATKKVDGSKSNINRHSSFEPSSPQNLTIPSVDNSLSLDRRLTCRGCHLNRDYFTQSTSLISLTSQPCSEPAVSLNAGLLGALDLSILWSTDHPHLRPFTSLPVCTPHAQSSSCLLATLSGDNLEASQKQVSSTMDDSNDHSSFLLSYRSLDSHPGLNRRTQSFSAAPAPSNAYAKYFPKLTSIHYHDVDDSELLRCITSTCTNTLPNPKVQQTSDDSGATTRSVNQAKSQTLKPHTLINTDRIFQFVFLRSNRRNLHPSTLDTDSQLTRKSSSQSENICPSNSDEEDIGTLNIPIHNTPPSNETNYYNLKVIRDSSNAILTSHESQVKGIQPFLQPGHSILKGRIDTSLPNASYVNLSKFWSNHPAAMTTASTKSTRFVKQIPSNMITDSHAYANLIPVVRRKAVFPKSSYSLHNMNVLRTGVSGMMLPISTNAVTNFFHSRSIDSTNDFNIRPIDMVPESDYSFLPEEIRDPSRNYAVVDLRPSPASSAIPSTNLTMNILQHQQHFHSSQTARFVSNSTDLSVPTISDLTGPTNSTSTESDCASDAATLTSDRIGTFPSLCCTNDTGKSNTFIKSTDNHTPSLQHPTDDAASRRHHSHSLSLVNAEPPSLNYVHVIASKTQFTNADFIRTCDSGAIPHANGNTTLEPSYSPSSSSGLGGIASRSITPPLVPPLSTSFGDVFSCRSMTSSATSSADGNPPDAGFSNGSPIVNQNSVSYTQLDFTRTLALGELSGDMANIVNGLSSNQHTSSASQPSGTIFNTRSKWAPTSKIDRSTSVRKSITQSIRSIGRNGRKKTDNYLY